MCKKVVARRPFHCIPALTGQHNGDRVATDARNTEEKVNLRGSLYAYPAADADDVSVDCSGFYPSEEAYPA